MLDNIVIRIMTAEDYEHVKEFLRHSFYTGEPLCMSSGENAEEHATATIHEYNLYLVNQGTSLIAFEKCANGTEGQLAGIVIAGAQYPSDIAKHYEEAEAAGPYIWGRILRFLSQLERNANIFERYKVNKVLYSHITTVNRTMRGKGLGSILASKLMDVGREKGYPLMIAYCTSFYSARQKQALGMHCAYEYPYADYKNEEGVPIFAPPAPHVSAKVMVIKL